MPYPVIKISSASGSDTAASGAGPTTAITGSNASTSADGLTVTLTGAGSLTGVATDGSAVLFLNDSTAGARNFGAITGVNDGTKEVTIKAGQAFRLSASGLSWAIGGMRASIANSYKLFQQSTSIAGDAKAGWTVEFSAGYTETLSTAWAVRVEGNTTDGFVKIIGNAANPPTLTFSGNTNGIDCFSVFVSFTNFILRCSFGGSRTSLKAINVPYGTVPFSYNLATKFRSIRANVSGFTFGQGFSTGSVAPFEITECDFSRSLTDGIYTSYCVRGVIIGNTVTDCGGDGIELAVYSASIVVANNVICANGGKGINQSGPSSHNVCILGNTVAGNASDGIAVVASFTELHVANNLITGNGGLGLSCAASAAVVQGYWVQGNNIYGNVGLPMSTVLDAIAVNTTTVDPQYADATNRNYTPTNPALRGTGWPQYFGTVRSYPTPGAVQPQAGSTIIIIDGDD